MTRRACPRRDAADVLIGGLLMGIATGRLTVEQAARVLPPDWRAKYDDRRHSDRRSVR